MNQNIETMNHVYHGDNTIHQRIQQLLKESKDPEFTRFLNSLGNALWQGQISDQYAACELDRNYYLYQQNMQCAASQMTTSIPSQTDYIYPTQFKDIKKPQDIRQKNMEFTMGAGVLGVTGAIFLLIAFVIFAMNFMSGLLKGICLYVIAASVILISELLVRRKQPKFATGMTAVGISGLFLCTVINYTYLSIFNSIVAFSLIALTAAVTLFFTYKKDSGVLRIIASSGSVICLLPMISYEDVNKYLIICFMVIIIQTATALIPTQKEQRAVWIIQMIVQCVSLAVISARGMRQGIITSLSPLVIVLMIALLNLLFLRAKVFAGSVITFCVIYCINISMLPAHMLNYPNYIYLIILAAITVFFNIVLKNNTCRWIPYWFFNAIAVINICENRGEHAYAPAGFICIISLFIWSKLISRVKALRVSECIITVITYIYCLGATQNRFENENVRIVMLLILAACYIISVAVLNYWHTFYEIMITLTVIACADALCPQIIIVPIVTGIIMLSIFAFSAIKKGKSESGLKTYNIVALCMMGICYIRMIFVDDIYVYIIMLLFGITVLVLLLDDKYKLPVKHKGTWIGCFLTYMFLILRTEYPVINSVLLAVTAILCVIMGFVSKDKPVRIYGIMMAVIVAAKVVMFDFGGMQPIQRMLAFLVVGILILMISYIYILLEKKLSHEDN